MPPSPPQCFVQTHYHLGLRRCIRLITFPDRQQKVNSTRGVRTSDPTCVVVHWLLIGVLHKPGHAANLDGPPFSMDLLAIFP